MSYLGSDHPSADMSPIKPFVSPRSAAVTESAVTAQMKSLALLCLLGSLQLVQCSDQRLFVSEKTRHSVFF